MIEELLKVFQEYQPTIGEILLTYGNLGYALGACIGGYQGKTGPSVEKLKQLYFEKPGDVAVSLMLEGMTVTSWFEDWEEQVLKQSNNKENWEKQETSETEQET